MQCDQYSYCLHFKQYKLTYEIPWQGRKSASHEAEQPATPCEVWILRYIHCVTISKVRQVSRSDRWKSHDINCWNGAWRSKFLCMRLGNLYSNISDSWKLDFAPIFGWFVFIILSMLFCQIVSDSFSLFDSKWIVFTCYQVGNTKLCNNRR